MRASILISYATLYLVWGSTYFFIRLAVQTMPPFWLVALRFILGGLGFIVYAALAGRLSGRLRPREVLISIGLGLLLLLVGNGLVSLAETSVDSYLVALLAATTPLIVGLFDYFLFSIRLGRSALIGILFGILGVGLLLYNGASIFTSFSTGIVFVVIGLLSWAFGTSLSQRAGAIPDLVLNTGVQMLSTGLIAGLGCLAFGPSPLEVFAGVSLESWLALGYLAVCGSLAFMAYTHLITNEPAIRVVSYAFVNPLIALFLGLVLGGEKPTPLLIPGTGLVLLGLGLMLWGGGFRAKKP